MRSAHVSLCHMDLKKTNGHKKCICGVNAACEDCWLVRRTQARESGSVCGQVVQRDKKTETKRKTEHVLPEAKHVRVTSNPPEEITAMCVRVFALRSVCVRVTWGQAGERHHQPPWPGVVQALCELPCRLLFLAVDLKKKNGPTTVSKQRYNSPLREIAYGHISPCEYKYHMTYTGSNASRSKGDKCSSMTNYSVMYCTFIYRLLPQ